MPIDAWLTYVATVFVLMIVPGPSHLLMLSNSLAHGFQPATATAAGDLTANLLQMLAAGLGLAAVVQTSRHGFAVVKWAGVVYLIWLGLRMLTTPPAPSDRQRRGRLWWQGFVTSAANPKAVVFFAALFPQFILPGEPFWPQLTVLAATYLAIDAGFLLSYGAGADWLAMRLRDRAALWLRRAGGGALVGAAVLLGMKTLRE